MPSECDANENLRACTENERIVDFLNEVGMLRFTPRSGYQFLGSGKENVAEHSHRTAIIGYVLARMAKADIARTTFLCLFHDLHEARTGDFNYVNKIYNQCQPKKALQDALEGTGLTEDILPLWDELCDNTSIEARLAHDADQLDLILNLKREADLGNKYAHTWLNASIKRLKTAYARELSEVILTVDASHWWYAGPNDNWWANKNNQTDHNL